MYTVTIHQGRKKPLVQSFARKDMALKRYAAAVCKATPDITHIILDGPGIRGDHWSLKRFRKMSMRGKPPMNALPGGR